MMLDTDDFVVSPVKTAGLAHVPNLTHESAKATEELLKDNNNRYHIFFTLEDHMGVYLHNHIAHHELTLWACGATPEQLRRHYERNALYMRDAVIVVEPLVLDLEDEALFTRCLGKEEHYRNFEMFFLNMSHKIGWRAVLQKYLLDGSPLADDMLYRIYMGYVHGLIHIGFALEFRQPRLLAEGLAQAAVHHDAWYTEYLSAAEAAAKEAREPALPLATLVDMVRQDPKISTASSWSFQTQTRARSGRWAMDKEPARDGVLRSAKPELVRLAARWRVGLDDLGPDGDGDGDEDEDEGARLERATAELINAAVYIVAGAQNPPYQCTFDFFLLHCATASVGHAALLRGEGAAGLATPAQKARLLELSGRVFLLTYAGMGAPALGLDHVASHRSRLGPGEEQGWPQVLARACDHDDDGHMIKLIRSTWLAEGASRPYDHRPEFRVKQPMFLQAAVAMIDSGTRRPMTWTKHWDFIRFCGFPEAWERFPKRDY